MLKAAERRGQDALFSRVCPLLAILWMCKPRAGWRQKRHVQVCFKSHDINTNIIIIVIIIIIIKSPPQPYFKHFSTHFLLLINYKYFPLHPRCPSNKRRWNWNYLPSRPIEYSKSYKINLSSWILHNLCPIIKILGKLTFEGTSSMIASFIVVCIENILLETWINYYLDKNTLLKTTV